MNQFADQDQQTIEKLQKEISDLKSDSKYVSQSINDTDAQIKELKEKHKVEVEKGKKTNHMQQAMKRYVMNLLNAELLRQSTEHERDKAQIDANKLIHQ